MENVTSDWLVLFVIVCLCVIVALLGVLLFLLRQAQRHKQHRLSEPSTVKPALTPGLKQIALRKQPQVSKTVFKRRQVPGATIKLTPTLENTDLPTPGAKPPVPPSKTANQTHQNGFAAKSKPTMKRREIKVELDAIHKTSGLPRRVCPCTKCQELRADVAS